MSIVPGADDSLIYTTLSGAVGMLVPFLSRDVSFIKSQFLCFISVVSKGIRVFPNHGDASTR
jgi:hypothetical protein